MLVVTRFKTRRAGAGSWPTTASYGLGAAVWTRDLSRAHRVSRRLKAGSVFVNNYNDGDMTVPFGGYKQSGNGRDKSLHALEKFTELKTIWIALEVLIMSEHTTSYYAASANRYEPFPTLDESISCDVCVVGGGYTGLSSALHLAEMGYDVVLLEGARIGFGASGRNGGQLVNSYSRDIDVIEKTYGPDAAKMLGSMMFEGGDIIRERIQRYQIACDYRPGGLFVALNHKQLETLEEQKANWERYGNTQLELLDASAIRREVDSDRYAGALLDHSGGHIHPLNLAIGEADAIRLNGGRVYEQSPVTRHSAQQPGGSDHRTRTGHRPLRDRRR